MFVRAPNPIWFMVDLIGQPLNDEYYAFFLTNTLPYLPQNVYRDPQGMTVWTGNVIEFYPNGTLPDNLYFDPNLVYRIEIRHGNSQADPLIYEINNFVPGDGLTPSNNSLAILGNENQISNSNFSHINFVSPLVISAAGTYNIAPDWYLILTGAGTTTITQLILSGDQFPANPPPPFPYALRFANSGWSTVTLQQRFFNNGAIWSLGAITGSIEGRAITIPQTVSMNYVPSNSSTAPGQPTAIFSKQFMTGDYQTINGAVDVNFTGNTNLGTSAYVDIQILLPATGTVDISNIQIIGQTSPLPITFNPLTDIPDYQQETDERIVDHLFHYYKSQLVTKPKRSLLTAWNFPLNPFQFGTTTVTTVSSITSYVCDQTILHQEAASQLQIGRNTIDQRQNLVVKAVTAATQTRFALIQYIDPKTTMPFWSYVLSAFARARIVTVHGTSVRLKCRLIYRSSLPSSIGNAEPISSWAANSDPTFAAGWTAIAPLNDPAYVLLNSYATDEVSGGTAYPAVSFDSFQMPEANNSNMTLGIVVYTMDNLNATSGTEDSIEFDKISLIPSYFGADAEAQTWDEVWRECQFYYERSYPLGTAVGANTAAGIRQFVDPLGGDYSSTILYKTSFNLIYNQVKRSIPSTTFYSEDGTINNIRLGVWNGTSYEAPSAGGNPVNIATSEWDVISSTMSGIYMRPNNTNAETIFTSPPGSRQGEMLFHYVADSRLGI